MKPRIIQVEKKELNYKDFIKREAVESDFASLVRDSVIIKEGDKIRDENSQLYRVVSGGVSRRTQGIIDYKEITIEEVT